MNVIQEASDLQKSHEIVAFITVTHVPILIITNEGHFTPTKTLRGT